MSWSERRPPHRDDGISLVEVIVALLIMALILGAAVAFFLNSLKVSGLQSQRQSAVALTNQAMERVQAVKPSDLLVGRSQAVVTALNAPADAQALTQEDDFSVVNYQLAPVAAVEIVKTTQRQTVNDVVYTLRTLINVCHLDTLSSACTRATPPDSIKVFRATVLTTWTPKGETCAGGCQVTVSQLVDNQNDPRFNVNISEPTIIDVVTGQLAVGVTRNITIKGTFFLAAVRVGMGKGGGTMGTVVSNSGTAIVVPWTAGMTPGSYPLTVLNRDGGRAVYNVTVTPNPAISSLSPTTLRAGSSTAVTLTGTGFQPGLTVTQSPGTAIGAYLSPTTASATLNPTSAGTATITMTNLDGGIGTFTYTVLPALLVLTGGVQAGPTAPAGQPTVVTLTGTGLVTGATVSVPSGFGMVGTVTVTGSTSATVEYTPTAAGQLTTFTLRNPDGQTASRNVSITTTAATPLTLTSVTPLNVRIGTTTTFTLTGTGFVGPLVVQALAPGYVLDAANETVIISTRATFQLAVPNFPFISPVTISVTNADGRRASLNVVIVAT